MILVKKLSNNNSDNINIIDILCIIKFNAGNLLLSRMTSNNLLGTCTCYQKDFFILFTQYM